MLVGFFSAALAEQTFQLEPGIIRKKKEEEGSEERDLQTLVLFTMAEKF